MFSGEMNTTEVSAENSFESSTGASKEIRELYSAIDNGFSEDPRAKPPITIGPEDIDTHLANGVPLQPDIIERIRAGEVFNLESS